MKLPVSYEALTAAERKAVREEYIRRQNNLCYHCEQPLDKLPPAALTTSIDWSLFPEGFLLSPIHLHHDHDTGLTIGAVHNFCNAELWQYHGE